MARSLAPSASRARTSWFLSAASLMFSYSLSRRRASSSAVREGGWTPPAGWLRTAVGRAVGAAEGGDGGGSGALNSPRMSARIPAPGSTEGGMLLPSGWATPAAEVGSLAPAELAARRASSLSLARASSWRRSMYARASASWACHSCSLSSAPSFPFPPSGRVSFSSASAASAVAMRPRGLASHPPPLGLGGPPLTYVTAPLGDTARRLSPPLAEGLYIAACHGEAASRLIRCPPRR
mmetsp:Transcript_63808/g.201846  ORF Transcript_63808/g.201846 Transcript_63808/m.201846 type:complete len:237 (-) Transcript_63808:189-899(-)